MFAIQLGAVWSASKSCLIFGRCSISGRERYRCVQVAAASNEWENIAPARSTWPLVVARYRTTGARVVLGRYRRLGCEVKAAVQSGSHDIFTRALDLKEILIRLSRDMVLRFIQ